MMVEAFEGNKAETKTMLPVIEAFKSAYDLAEVTVVADAGMISEANREGIEDAGLSFIIGERIPEVPFVIKQWRRENPDAVPEDGQVFTAPWPATGKKKAAGRRDKVTYYQYRADRARRTIRGIDQQIAKAENAVAGKAAVKRNGSSSSPAAPGPSTATWNPRPVRWRGSRPTSPTSTTPRPSS